MEKTVGIAVGMVVGILLAVLVLKLTKKNGRIRCEYDERQELVRGRGYKYGYFTLVLYMTLYAVLTLAEIPLPADNYMIMLTGLLISVGVHVIYCVWHEAYISLNENPKRLVAAFTVIGLINIGFGVVNLVRGEMIKNGVLSFHASNLAAGIMCIVVCLAVVFKRKSAVRAEEED